MKTITAVLIALALALAPSAALAGGSDSPTPYTLDTEGLTLPGDAVFVDGGHVNIKYLSGGVVKSKGIHFESLNNQPSGKWIGRSFIPWSAFAADIECITWVQVHGYNEHFGEGGQEPLCLTKPPTAPPTDHELREVVTSINCDERIVNWSKEKREAIFDYDWAVPGWVNVGWADWVVVESGFRNEKAPECGDLPVVGSPVNASILALGLLLVAGGAALTIRTARR